MILEFMTKRNINGHRQYLGIDTGAEIYSTQCRYMIPEGIEVKAKDIRELKEMCKRNGYREVDYIS